MSDATPAPATEGLSDNAASGLAYITFIPAIVFLAVAPFNQKKEVRFHAWQSIFFSAVWIALWIVLTIVSIAMAFVPFLNLLLIPIHLVIWLGGLILWILCLVNAFQGKRFNIPVIAGFAAKQAGV